MSLTRTEHDARDLVQETFLTWAEKGAQLRDTSRVKSWLFTALYRRFLEGQRRLTRFPHVDIHAIQIDLPAVEADPSARLDAAAVAGLLAELEPQYRAAVALFYLEDYSYLEIAAIMDVPLGTVKSRIARGLVQLKALVQRPSKTKPARGQS
jgi:RNA polymerase sigma-70 factor (ECF subfamily)